MRRVLVIPLALAAMGLSTLAANDPPPMTMKLVSVKTQDEMCYHSVRVKLKVHKDVAATLPPGPYDTYVRFFRDNTFESFHVFEPRQTKGDYIITGTMTAIDRLPLRYAPYTLHAEIWLYQAYPDYPTPGGGTGPIASASIYIAQPPVPGHCS